MAFRRGRFRRGRRQLKARFFLFLLAAFLLGGYLLFNILLLPVLKTSAVYKARTIATNTINNAVGVVLEEDDISYDKLVIFDKDSNGAITAIKSDTMQINLLKYDITKEVIAELANVGGSEIRIPIGTIMGGQLLTGRGPNIHIKFQPVGNVNSQITSAFTSEGINQTRQQIMLDIRADITVMISSYNVSTSVDTNYCIADSVIVGPIPGSYTVVDGADDQSDKLFIYGGAKSGTSSAK